MSLIGLNRRYSANILQIKKPVIPKSLESTGFVGDLGRIQTYNLLSRNQVVPLFALLYITYFITYKFKNSQ